MQEHHYSIDKWKCPKQGTDTQEKMINYLFIFAVNDDPHKKRT